MGQEGSFSQELFFPHVQACTHLAAMSPLQDAAWGEDSSTFCQKKTTQLFIYRPPCPVWFGAKAAQQWLHWTKPPYLRLCGGFLPQNVFLIYTPMDLIHLPAGSNFPLLHLFSVPNNLAAQTNCTHTVIGYGFIKEGVLQPSVLVCLIVQFNDREELVSPRADVLALESNVEANKSRPRKDLAQVFKKDSSSFNETTMTEQEAYYQCKGEKCL